eukprot:TRINITY_DN14920_c0_g1_i4.p1 TRINITY_DN14920_c0_g1~~TRINITY_DN14920_c0_g1_i4.p1  ORF type:complete len:639 (-),score=123.46 TRINITY_DN14920_c0_g1_i4:454-2370(-)
MAARRAKSSSGGGAKETADLADSTTGARCKESAATSTPAAAAAAAATSEWCNTIVGIVAGLVMGVAAVLAIGGDSEYSPFSVFATAFIFVGPVAYGGLQISMNQLRIVFNYWQGPRSSDESSAASAATSSSAGSVGAKATAAAAGGSGAASAKSGGDCKAEEAATEEPTAFDMLTETWRNAPTLGGFCRGLASAVAGAPAGIAALPSRLYTFWQWLVRPRWKPFPWVYLPDPIAFAWGVVEILFIAPIVAIEILVTVPTMELIKAEWRQKRLAWLREALPEMVRSVSRPLGRLMMRDPRNHSYLPWMLLLGVCTPALFFWAMKRHAQFGLEFSTLCIYHLLRVGPRFQLFAHVHTLTHKEGHSHRGLFHGPFQVLNCVTEWWIAPFYGVVPWNYYIAHMKIHHRWHNDVDDVHTNLDLDRTNPLSFFLYVPRFTLYWTGVSPLALFYKRGEWKLIAKLLYGMVAYYGVMAFLFWWNPIFCVVYWMFPHMEACVFLCAISYLWHAFVEEKDPGNQYVNSVTILDGHDNVWNEDYHVVHHHAPNTHWTDAPAHFEAHREHYAAVTATIFRDCEQGKLLQWLFEQNWDEMASHFVDLNDRLTHEEKRSLIVRRLGVIVGAEGRDGKRKEWAATSSIREFTE